MLSAKKGKRQLAFRTWQMIKRLGIVPAIELKVSTGFTALAEMGQMESAFQTVIFLHPESPPEANRHIPRSAECEMTVSRFVNWNHKAGALFCL